MFPPQGGPGVQRSVKFVKYLPQFGWDSVVLTPRCTTWSQRDETLLKDIPPGTTVMKTYTAEPKPGPKGVFHYIIWGALKPLSVPDHGNWWLPWAVPAAMRVLRECPIQAILATGGPFSSHILGAILKVKTGLPLILDYRDDWTLDPVLRAMHPFYWVLFEPYERLMHRWVVNKADKVLLVTEGSRHIFAEHYSHPEKFVTIRNGYDPDDFTSACEPNLPPDKFHVVYAGSTKGYASSSQTFLQGLRLAIDRDAALRESVQVSFVGAIEQRCKDLIKDLELGPYVRVIGYVPHSQSIGYLRRADVLLLTMRSVYPHVPGKVYEYLGARKPLLLLAPQGTEVVELVTRAGSAQTADPNDPSDIAEKLMHLEGLWRRRALPYQSDEVLLRTLTRKELTRQLAQVLDEVSTMSP